MSALLVFVGHISCAATAIADEYADLFSEARRAAEQADFHQAIALLESLAALENNPANLDLELGVLYLRVQRPQLAEEYLRRALLSNEMPFEVRRRAMRYFDIARNQNSKHAFDYRLGIGALYDDNVAATPSDENVFLADFNAAFDEEELEVSDVATTLDVQMLHTYWFGEFSDHRFETSLSFDSRWYQDETDFNLYQAALQLGPKFQLSRSLLFSVHGQASGAYLDGERYLTTTGGGIEFQYQRSPWTLSASISHVEMSFESTELRPTVDERDGGRTQGTVVWSLYTQAGWILSLGGVGEENVADVDWESFERFGGFVSAGKRFQIGKRWMEFGLSGVYQETDYDAPDPFVISSITREDQRSSVSAYVRLPVFRRVQIQLGANYIDNGSAIPNFEFDNTSVSLTLVYSGWRTQ